MKWIAITSPSFYEGEVAFLHDLFAAGVDLVHLRKPEATPEQCMTLLDALTDDERRRVVVHRFFELAPRYGLHGIHLNSYNSTPLPGYGGSISRSCHTLEEVVRYKPECRYVFLSPIFDSISKHGYHATFTEEALLKAAADGTIDPQVYALGGVVPESLPTLSRLHFGGAAMLGHVNALASLPHDRMTAELKRIRECYDKY